VSAGDSAGSSGGDVEIDAGAGGPVGGNIALRSGAGSTSGAVSIQSADGGMSGNVCVAGGMSSAQSGGHVSVTGGGSAVGAGGSVELRSGAGQTCGAITLAGHGDAGLVVDSAGGLALASAPGQDVAVSSGGDVVATASSMSSEVSGEFQIKHTNSANEGHVMMRVTEDSIISHVPHQAVSYNSPSDRRIKKDITGVDSDDILQRLQDLEVTEYAYTDEWRSVRGIEDVKVRGVIAQQVAEHFP